MTILKLVPVITWQQEKVLTLGSTIKLFVIFGIEEVDEEVTNTVGSESPYQIRLLHMLMPELIFSAITQSKLTLKDPRTSQEHDESRIMWIKDQ